MSLDVSAAGDTPNAPRGNSAIDDQVINDQVINDQVINDQVIVDAGAGGIRAVPLDNELATDLDARRIAYVRGPDSMPSFVGRTDERKFLSRRLAAALAGSPSVVIIDGEPGIGKSRLAREVVREAVKFGFDVSIGRCERAFTIPYLPLVDDFFPRLASVADDPRLVAHSEFLSNVSGWAAGQSEAPRNSATAMFAIRQAVLALSRRRPLMLFVDDVQWADTLSVDLLVHLARAATDASLSEPVRFLLLLAERRSEATPTLQQLELIRREATTFSLNLSGLAELHVASLVKGHGLEGMPRDWVRALHEVSRGNPLFVTAISREVKRSGRSPVGPDVSAVPWPLPSEISALIGVGIDSLSNGCRRFLGRMAVAGYFDPVILGPETIVHDDGALRSMADHMAEAHAAGILEGADGDWQFSHPMYAHACRNVLTVDERQRLHAVIGRALLCAPGSHTSVDQPLIAAFHHLVAAGPHAEPAELIAIGYEAGERALKLYAWHDAASCFETTLVAYETTGDCPRDVRIRLLNGAGYAREHNGEPAVALAHFAAAIELLDDADPAVAARVWMNKLDTEIVSAGMRESMQTAPLELLAEQLRTESPALTAELYGTLAQAYWASGRIGPARDAATLAIEIGTPVEQHHACEAGHRQLATTLWISLEIREAMAHFENARRHAQAGRDPKRLTGPLMRIPLNLVWLGRLADAEAAVEAATRLSRDVNYSLENGLVLAATAMMGTARGMFSEAETAATAALDLERITGYRWATPLVLPTLAAARLALGHEEGVEEVLESWMPQGGTSSVHAITARLVRHIVQLDRGERWTVETAFADEPIAVEPRWRQFGGDTACGLLLEVASAIGRPELAAGAGDLLSDLYRKGQLFTTTMALLVPRLLGLALELQGDNAAAAGMLDAALGTAVRLGAHTEAARAGMGLARVLAKNPSSAQRAATLAANARRLGESLGLVPFCRSNQALCEQLDVQRIMAAGKFGAFGTSPDTASPAIALQGFASSALDDEGGVTLQSVVILFTDIADSTLLTEQMGDWAFREQARALDLELRELVVRFGGRLVEGITLGDGLLADFNSALAAVRCALRCQEVSTERRLAIHTGLHAGDVIREGGNIFGGAVNLAARVCSAAATGHVVVSQTVRDLARTSADTEFEDIGKAELRGIAEPVRLFRAVARGTARGE